MARPVRWRPPAVRAGDGWCCGVPYQWRGAARTADKTEFLAYFEKGCPRSLVRGARPMAIYTAQWFDPRAGAWSPVRDGKLQSDNIGEIRLPDFPGDNDWGLRLSYSAAVPLPKHF